MQMLCINKRHSKEYGCIAELLVYCRRMKVRRIDKNLEELYGVTSFG